MTALQQMRNLEPILASVPRPAALSQRQSYLYPTWLAWSIRRAYPL